jgi:SagB-type dehydrogenase family enzyme
MNKIEDVSRKICIIICASILLSFLIAPNLLSARQKDEISLPKPSLKGALSVEEAIKARRCIRSFKAKPLTMKQLSQILWAAQGITQDGGFMRAAPSAGALYPLELFAVVGNNSIEGLKAGVYQYIPASHSMKVLLKNDVRKDIMKAALDQECIAQAPINIIITADYNRTAKKYGGRAVRYVHIEVGHAGENIMLQAISLGLSSVIIGAFYDEKLSFALQLPPELKPLLIIPVGYKK